MKENQNTEWKESWRVPLVRGEKWGEKATATRLALVQAMRRNPQISTVPLAAETWHAR